MKPDFKPMTPPISSRGNATSINTTSTPRIHMLNVNGTMLPMEQKPGQSKYTIPDFVLSDKPKNLLSGPLVLYQKSTLCQSPTITELSDSDSITSEEFDEEYEPMDLD
ncbi:hypothetical protein CU098_011486 [Rhizopus stolonifer]|uniref:Uncharacterized protein n=1 Tax=Rhizopus stolonifer TaxID=4846 RepID=A0A367KYU4_RHIST|nr:hypothetical protein CU098_011486 [Rhizopus stolonifer]